jgi:hypothetical protein
VLGLLRHSHDNETGKVAGILKVSQRQPYTDGTVFVIKDIRGFCQTIMQAYAQLNTDAIKILRDAGEIDVFLDTNLRHYANQGTIKGGVVPASSNMPWKALKHSLQEAGTGPLHLALKNGLGKKEEENEDEETASKKRRKGRDREDWYTQVNPFKVNAFS